MEFVSKRKRDRDRDNIEKKAEYGKAGVKEYWIIDRFQRKMTVVQYKGRSQKVTVVAEKDIYRTPHLPGFELILARILEAADRIAQATLRKPRRHKR